MIKPSRSFVLTAITLLIIAAAAVLSFYGVVFLENRMGAGLHQAVYLGDVEAAKAMIASGADVNARDAAGATPLHSAVFGNSLQAVKLLLENGADPTATNQFGESSVLIATTTNNAQMVALTLSLIPEPTLRQAATDPQWKITILAPDADPKLYSALFHRFHGITLLHLAAKYNAVHIAGILIDAGADVSASDDDGQSPLDYATNAKDPNADLITLLQSAETKPRNKP